VRRSKAQHVYFGDYGGYDLPDDTREYLARDRVNLDDQIEGIRQDETLSDEEKQAEIDIAREKQAIIDSLTGSGPRPTDLSAEAEAYQQFLGQLADGVADDKPFFYTSFREWGEEYNQPPATVHTISASPQPPPPPEGRETAILIADWFNIEEAGNLGIPPQGP
jgi:hypothetical protein